MAKTRFLDQIFTYLTDARDGKLFLDPIFYSNI